MVSYPWIIASAPCGSTSACIKIRTRTQRAIEITSAALHRTLMIRVSLVLLRENISIKKPGRLRSARFVEKLGSPGIFGIEKPGSPGIFGIVSVTWNAVPGNESDNVSGRYFEGKFVLVKYEALWPIWPKRCHRLAAEGHPAFDPGIAFNLKGSPCCVIALSVRRTRVYCMHHCSAGPFLFFPKPYHHATSLGPSVLFFYVDQFQPKVFVQNIKEIATFHEWKLLSIHPCQ